MGEYMASGRPILVHAPPDSFLSWYFKKYECGLVVDRNKPVELAHAIQQILDDGVLREQLKKNALARARTDFYLATARADFIKLLKPIVEE
jgi:glycosyltransferase involved in cell wall biosynthesis